jgi:hypothetical protein
MAPPMNPGMMSGGMYNMEQTQQGQQQLPSMMPHQMAARPPVENNKNANSVKVPAQPAKPKEWKDISEYENIYDWVYIVVGVILVEIIVLFLVRYFPEFFGKYVNVWYNRFKLSAVMSDIFIILVGFAISRYIYSEWIYPNYDWSPLYFTATTVATQLVHDLLFYVGVIRPLPTGENAMIDVMKDYAHECGAKILAADSLMVIGSSVFAMLLKGSSPHVVASLAILSTYMIPYILEKKNVYSTIS